MSIKTKVAGMRAVMAFDNWPVLLLGRLFYRKTGLVVYCKNHLEILVDHRGGDEAEHGNALWAICIANTCHNSSFRGLRMFWTLARMEGDFR